MQLNKNYEHERELEEKSMIKYFDPNKIIIYYVLKNKIKEFEQEKEEKHPADEEIFREVREKDKELGLLEEMLKKQSAEEMLEKMMRQQLYYILDLHNKTIPPMYYNYILPEQARKKDMKDYFIITPGNITLIRATQAELGDGVLGVAYLGKNLIKVLDSLYGTDFDEVFRHEVNHILYPHMLEREIRNMTRQQVCYETKYN